MNKHEKQVLFITLALAFFLLSALMLEYGIFQNPQDKFSSDSVNSGMLAYGNLGASLRQLGLVRPVNAIPSETGTGERTNETFRKKRSASDARFVATVSGTADLPGHLPDAAILNKRIPVLSLYVDEKDLHDPDTGMLANRSEHFAHHWERISSVHYYAGGQLQFHTWAGLRNHGKSIRLMPNHLSFRVYFRRIYGLESVPRGMLFSENVYPLDRFVLKKLEDDEFFINDLLAMDCADMLGLPTPQRRFLELYLNGKSLGLYVAYEHVNETYWRKKLGKPDLTALRIQEIPDFKEEIRVFKFYRQTMKRFENLPVPLTTQTVSQDVDLDNMTASLFLQAFTALDLAFQGLAYQQEDSSGTHWHWVGWDYDLAFVDFFPDKNQRQPIWKQKGIEHLTDTSGPRDLRQIIFRRLIADDPGYREFFLRQAADFMNHKLPPEKLIDRLDWYQDFLQAYTSYDVSRSLKKYRDFVANRHEYMRSNISETLDAGPWYTLTINKRNRNHLKIDGYPVEGSYTGYYLGGQEATLELDEPARGRKISWIVNDETIIGDKITIALTRDTVIRPVVQRRK